LSPRHKEGKRLLTICDDSISSFVGDAAYKFPLVAIRKEK